jgi:hypothetical protein
MTSDKVDFNRSYPAYPMHYDQDFNYRKDRQFWLKVLLSLYFGTYAYRKLDLESKRLRYIKRMEGFPNMPAHHFHNRGGVVVLKDFVGFEKYF